MCVHTCVHAHVHVDVNVDVDVDVDVGVCVRARAELVCARGQILTSIAGLLEDLICHKALNPYPRNEKRDLMRADVIARALGRDKGLRLRQCAGV